MKKLAVQLITELTSLTGAIPAGFKGLFAKSSGLFWKNSDGTQKQIATSDHKFHAFSPGQYFYDDYSHANYLRLFMETASFDAIRFQIPTVVEYFDGTSFVPWAGGDTLIKNLLDGREDTQLALDHTHRNFRFEITKSNYPLTSLIVLQSVWSAIVYPGCTITIESWDTTNLIWILRDTVVFSYPNTSNDFGVHMKVNSSLHDGSTKIRININFNDWIDVQGASGYTTMPLRRLCIFSNYRGFKQIPFSWNWGKQVTFDANVVSSEIINFDASIEPTQTGASVTKTSTWMWQYLAQGIKWLRANFANYLPLTGGTMSNTNLVTNLNANYLEGILSNRIPYGANNTATTRLDTNLNLIDKSGFYFCGSTTLNIPIDSKAFTVIHSNYSDNNKLGFQIAHAHDSDRLFVRRRLDATTYASWRELAPQIQTDWNASSGMGVLLNKPASLPANGGNADTLEGLSSSAFAKIGTAFTSFGNIAGNNADCAVFVIDTSSRWISNAIHEILANNITLPSGTSSMVLILQPGIYEIVHAIDFDALNIKAIIGLCKDSTIINVANPDLILNLELIENLTINIQGNSGDIIFGGSALQKNEAHNLKIKYAGSLGYDIEIMCFASYSCINNCIVEGITGVAYKSNNISNITHICENINNYTSVAALQRAVNVSNFTGRYSLPIEVGKDCRNLENFSIEFLAADSLLIGCFNDCSMLSNINILNCDIGFNSCEVISNSIVETDAGNTGTVGFSNCILLSNCKAVAYVGFGGCNNIVSSEASVCNIGFYSSNKISLSRGSGCSTYGFDSCTGMVQNISDSYNSCFSDSNAIYAVADTPDGGFNS